MDVTLAREDDNISKAHLNLALSSALKKTLPRICHEGGVPFPFFKKKLKTIKSHSLTVKMCFGHSLGFIQNIKMPVSP